MSICTDAYRPAVIRPRRIRQAECSAFEGLNRWINLVATFNLTPDPGDNDPASALCAWSAWDLPVTVAAQDVDTRGNDLLFVGIANRVYVLDWDAFRDQWNWEAFGPIYRRLTIGPIPGNRDETEDGPYQLAGLKRFRRFTFQLAEDPADDPVTSQYKITVDEDGADGAEAAYGTRRLQRHGNAQIARRGYSFLVTLEHEANEDFPMLWWQAEYENLGDRRANDPVVDV